MSCMNQKMLSIRGKQLFLFHVFLVQVALVEGLYQVFKATLDVYCDGMNTYYSRANYCIVDL